MKTKMLIIIAGILLMYWIACKPVGIIQLYRYELADNLKDSTLYVLLEDNSANIQLLQKYNKPKEADKLAKEDSLNNANIKLAFDNNYRFSDFAFVNKELRSVSPTKTYAFFSIERGISSNETIINDFLIRLTIINSTRTLTFETSGAMTQQAIVFLVKQANEKLQDLYELAQKHKTVK
ncbi:MAG: hypothetical protein IPM47_00470 [Sphingobacteriales bacterium]|nr:MAG: hypothetical protein IPM47_00470 [Sphingobacteriales bacterium]